MMPAENRYQALTSPRKLRGAYYTPPELVAMILDALPLTSASVIIDPSCGDGSFLAGAVAAVARKRSGAGVEGARHWSRRIIGFDLDAAAVAAARRTLQKAFCAHFGARLPPEALRVYATDVLTNGSLPDVFRSIGLSPPAPAEGLMVVGNPPYVEAKRLPRETKAALKARYPLASDGAPDLYLYFLHVCLNWLRPQDLLAFVLPNKLLVNANARAIREYLLRAVRLRDLWFATQAEIFPGAAVYPIVLFAQGASGVATASSRVCHISRTANRLTRGAPASVATDHYRRTAAHAFFPFPEEPALREALDTLLVKLDGGRLGDVLDIRWSVSFHRSGLRERYVTLGQPASPHARRFLGGGAFHGNGEVSRYRADWAGWWIDYDEDRLRAKRNCLPELSIFEQPKIVICQNGRSLRAAFDEHAFVLKDTFLCGLIRDRDHPLSRHPRAIVGLLCSRAAHFFYSHVFYGGHVNGGYLHFLRSFLVDVPLGAWTDVAAQKVADLVRRRELAETPKEQFALEEAMERAVSDALDLPPAARKSIAEWSAGDANWQGRERIRRPAPRSAAEPGAGS